jgi:hypothetical protein
MSAKYTYRSLAYDAGNPIKKLILIMMSDIADDSGVCFPSHNTIALRCGVSSSTTRKHIDDLIKTGIIFKQNRFNDRGQTSNNYKICLPMTEWESSTPMPRDGTPPAGKKQGPLPGSGDESTQLESTQLNIKDNVGQDQRELITKAFEHVWKQWRAVKKEIGTDDNSVKSDAKNKAWIKLFNAAYFKSNDISYFKLEINAIVKKIKATHQTTDFNSYKNMHCVNFLKKTPWRKENV